jgi:O-antigen/teichoic acid export membrane protein
MTTIPGILTALPPAADAPARVDQTGIELKRGALLNTIAMLASNFRGIFTFLIAWLLGPVALGTYSIAWAATDIISKVGILGIDNAITPLIARSEAQRDYARSKMLFRLAVMTAVVLCAVSASVTNLLLYLFADHFGTQREVLSALAVIVWALPGLALYRVGTAVSRGMKVMKHDIYSRGIADSIVTSLAFLVVLVLGFKRFAPELAVIAGTAASGSVAVVLAAKLFRTVSAKINIVSYRRETEQLLRYAAPISGYQLLNTLISRLDLILLGSFVGRAPGVTLTTVGIYAAVIEIANGLRKVNQAFNPIFAPVVAGMMATGDDETAVRTYARLAQWMLWILLPLVVVMALAGDGILMLYSPVFRQGGQWLGIVALGCAINAFVSLGETVILVERPHLNFLNSLITCAVTVGVNLLLIPRFGVMGAAFGILLPHLTQGILRHAALRYVFRWPSRWRHLLPPLMAAIPALVPALICRALVDGIAGELTSAAVFIAIYTAVWLYHLRSSQRPPHA